MSERRSQTSKALWAFYAVSLGLHALLAIGAVVAPEESRPSEAVAIALQEIHEAQSAAEPPPPPPPPKPPPPKPEEKPKEPEPEPEPAQEAEADAGDDPSQFEDLGMMAGPATAGPGVAVAMNRPRPKAETKAEPVRKKVASLGPKPGDCSDPPVKPKPLKIVKPAYNEAAHQAEIEGIVRVEALIDENGKVLAVRVLQGIGHGLDEAAIEAVQQMEWAPASQCGKPVKFPFAFNLRFTLAS